MGKMKGWNWQNSGHSVFDCKCSGCQENWQAYEQDGRQAAKAQYEAAGLDVNSGHKGTFGSIDTTPTFGYGRNIYA